MNKITLGALTLSLLTIAFLWNKSESLVLGTQIQEFPSSSGSFTIPTDIQRPTSILNPTTYPTLTIIPYLSSTPTPIPTVPIQTLYPTVHVTSDPRGDYATRLQKCLNDKENDPLTKQAEMDREIYNNPSSTTEEKNSAIARLSTYNTTVAYKYDCFETSYTRPTALCNDGTYSYSQDRSGTCSYHGGVSQWFMSAP